jgi:hypothetical protein
MEPHLPTNEHEKKVHALITEFRRIIHESSHLLANSSLKRCRAIVELDPITRVPIRRQTRFATDPKILNGEYDAGLLKLRNNSLMEYLLEDWQRIGVMWASGCNGYVLSLRDVIDPDAPGDALLNSRFVIATEREVFLGWASVRLALRFTSFLAIFA